MKNPTTTYLKKEVSQRIKARRVALQFSQQDIADLLGINRVSYISLENGYNAIKLVYMFNLCRIFECTPSDLFPPIPKLKIKKVLKKREVVKSYTYLKIN